MKGGNIQYLSYVNTFDTQSRQQSVPFLYRLCLSIAIGTIDVHRLDCPINTIPLQLT